MAPKGYLKVYHGCMCSGKTTSALIDASTWSATNNSVLVIGHVKDTRSDSTLSTNSSIIKASHFTGRKYDKLPTDDYEYFKGFDVIVIDEAQFFDDTILTFVGHLVEVLKKYVLVAGLDLSYKRKQMGYVLTLSSMADESIHTKAICSECCTKPAIYTYRSSSLGEGIVIGGIETYKPTCRWCWIKLTNSDTSDWK